MNNTTYNGTGDNNGSPGGSELEDQLFLAYYVILLVLTVAGNTLVCVAIYVDIRLRSPTNWFIASLAVSDLLYGLAGLPFRIASHVTPMTSSEVCSLWIWIDMVCAAASMANLAVISVDRYLKITKPFCYHRNMTRKRSLLAIGGVWVYAATLATFAIIKWPGAGGVIIEYEICRNDNKVFYTVANIVAFLSPLTVLIASYTMIFRTALAQFNKMKHMIVSTSTKEDRHKQKSVVRDFKATKTLAVVLGTFTVCWAPFFIMFTISQYNPDYLMGLPRGVALAFYFIFFLILPNLNSACNPVIYAYFNAEFRRAFRKIVWSSCEGELVDQGSHKKRRRSSLTSFFQTTFARRNSPNAAGSDKNHNSSGDDERTILNGETTLVTQV
ncbi:hypothetical protein ACROYT_G025736 [Oculina patagonica]